MQWLVLLLIGALLGVFARFVMMFNSGITMGFCALMGILGALAGGVLYELSPTALFGSHTFYLMGALVSIALLVGGILAQTLTAREKRI